MLCRSAVVVALLVALGAALASEPKGLEGEFFIESALKKNMLLDVRGGKAEDLTLIQLAGPGGDQLNRRWKFIRVADGEFLIETALAEGFYLDARAAKSEDGTLIQLGKGRDQRNREWRLIPVEKGEYLIESRLKKGVFLEVKDGKAENEVAIHLGGNSDGGKDIERRRWRLIPAPRR